MLHLERLWWRTCGLAQNVTTSCQLVSKLEKGTLHSVRGKSGAAAMKETQALCLFPWLFVNCLRYVSTSKSAGPLTVEPVSINSEHIQRRWVKVTTRGERDN
jgi:hypothetical protein